MTSLEHIDIDGEEDSESDNLNNMEDDVLSIPIAVKLIPFEEGNISFLVVYQALIAHLLYNNLKRLITSKNTGIFESNDHQWKSSRAQYFETY